MTKSPKPEDGRDETSGFVEIDGVELKLSQPYDAPGPWIGQQEILMQLLACWITVDEADLPLTPRLTGSPGVGKTQLAIAAAKAQGRPLYIYQCTADTRPEDLLITPVLSQGGGSRITLRPWFRQ
jgi:MoxR-like ATPase